MPVLPQKRRDQTPPAKTTLSQAMATFFRHNAADLAGGGFDPTHGTVGEDLAAGGADGIGYGGCGFLWFGAAIIRGVERAFPSYRRARQQVV